jgi:hypothetical protein
MVALHVTSDKLKRGLGKKVTWRRFAYVGGKRALDSHSVQEKSAKKGPMFVERMRQAAG